MSMNLSQGHIAMYPDPSPTGQQQPHVFMATTGPYTLLGFVPGQQQLYQQSLMNSFSTIALQLPHNSVNYWVADLGASHHTTHSVSNISNPRPLNSASPSSIVVGNGSTLPVTSVGDSVYGV
jgi:hypothetical protein